MEFFEGCKNRGEDVKGARTTTVVGFDTRITIYTIFTSNLSNPKSNRSGKQGSANSLLAQRLKMRKKDSLKSG